jgi:hypothetical protein
MGWIKMLYDWNWSGADTAYKRSFELEPGNADVYEAQPFWQER